MNLHGQIMNIQVNPDKMSTALGIDGGKTPALLAYKLGHRDARHDAAELVLHTDAILARLAELLENAFQAGYNAGAESETRIHVQDAMSYVQGVVKELKL